MPCIRVLVQTLSEVFHQGLFNDGLEIPGRPTVDFGFRHLSRFKFDIFKKGCNPSPTRSACMHDPKCAAGTS